MKTPIENTVKYMYSAAMALAMALSVNAETIGIFYNAVGDNQINFAAKDINAALVAKNHTVETFTLNQLAANYPNKKIVIGLSTDTAINSVLTAQGGTIPATLSTEGYALRTTNSGAKSYWVVGKDLNGAMYGGLQVAENINFYGFSRDFTEDAKPKIENRGIKLNLPFDHVSQTYFNGNISTGARFSIAQTWDYSFWTTWFDEMARNRFNHVSVWSNHPFTSMIRLPGYDAAAPNGVQIEDVTGYPNYDTFSAAGEARDDGVIKKMTIDEKVVFWKQVMAYAKARGFSFYLINWNTFVNGAEGKYGITRDEKNVNTKEYLRKSMYTLFKTYENLDGFGITQGEAMSGTDDERSKFLGETYGEGMAMYARELKANNNPRKLHFIHRWWLATETQIKDNFASLLACDNVTFDMSFKYSFAHMYSSTKPDLMGTDEFNFLNNNTLRAAGMPKLRSWLTVRNDDFYFHNWGSPAYAREYISRIFTMDGAANWFKGFYMGSDGYNPTRTFFSKLSTTQGILEVQRMWYMNKIWGRLSYDPTTSDDLFKEHIKRKLGLVSGDDLFDAWQSVSNALPLVGEMIFKEYQNDQGWYPEFCQGQSQGNAPAYSGFLKVEHFAAGTPRSTSEYASYKATASNNLGGKTSAFTAAQRVSDRADLALLKVGAMNPVFDSELGIAVNTVKAMSYLSKYYSCKMRAAIYFSGGAAKATEMATELRAAYSWWIKYTNLMHSMYKGMEMQRNTSFTDWHQHDALALAEATGITGSFTLSTPISPAASGQVSASNVKTIYAPGDLVTLTAQANPGFMFSGWSGDLSGQENPIKMTMASNMAVTAVFVPKVPASLPWVESFYGPNRSTSGGIPTAWTASRTSGAFALTSDRLVITGAGGVGTFETDDINVEGSNVTISLDVQSEFGQMDGGATPDYVRVYKIVDGTLVSTPIIEVLGDAAGVAVMKFTHTHTSPLGSTLRLRILTSVNDVKEYYALDNLKIERVGGAALPIVTVSASNSTASEPNGVDTFTFMRTGDTSQALRVEYNVVGSATDGIDYQSLGTFVDIIAGQASATKTLSVIDDQVFEGTETAIVTLKNKATYTVGTLLYSATVNIADNEVPAALPEVTVTSNPVSAAEPATTGTFTFTRTGDTSQALRVEYNVVGSATDGTDYQSLGTFVDIIAGQASATKTFSVIDDQVAEGTETAIVTLKNITTYTVGTLNSATINIADNEPVAIGERVPWNVNFNATAPGATSEASAPSWAATRSSGSFNVNTQRLTINAGSTEGVFTSGMIDISAGSVNLSMGILGAGGLDLTGTAQDYVRLYTKVDGGAETLVREVLGAQAAATWTKSGITGNTLQIVVRAKVTGSDEFYYLDDFSVTSSFDSWASNYSLTEAQALITADPDGDGVVNLIEYTLGLSPTLPDVNPIKVDQVVVGGKNYLQLSVNRNTAVKNVLIEGLTSATYANPAVWSTVDTVTVVNTDTVYTVRDSISIDTGAKRFLRLRFTLK